MLLHKKLVQGICEFDIEKLLVHIALTDLLIIHDWQVVYHIEESVLGNVVKEW